MLATVANNARQKKKELGKPCSLQVHDVKIHCYSGLYKAVKDETLLGWAGAGGGASARHNSLRNWVLTSCVMNSAERRQQCTHSRGLPREQFPFQYKYVDGLQCSHS